jgi:hypothetical protein
MNVAIRGLGLVDESCECTPGFVTVETMILRLDGWESDEVEKQISPLRCAPVGMKFSVSVH